MENSVDQKKLRGKRVKLVRNMMVLTIVAFAKKLGLSRGTIIGWENNKAGGLTEKGAENITNLAKRFDIECSHIWLMHGIGAPPAFFNNNPYALGSVNDITLNDIEFFDIIRNEIDSFISNYENAIITQIQDDSMLPFFSALDLVGGIKVHKTNIKKIIGKNCIIETNSGEVFVRKVERTDEKGFFELVKTNSLLQTENQRYNSADILSVAPIIWARYLN